MLNIILNIILIPKYGIMGAAWATLISLLVIGVLRIIEVKKILGLSMYSYKLLKPIFAGFITCIAIIGIRSYIMNYHTVITLLLALLFSIIIYGLVLWLLRLEPEDYDFLYGLNILSRNIKR